MNSSRTSPGNHLSRGVAPRKHGRGFSAERVEETRLRFEVVVEGTVIVEVFRRDVGEYATGELDSRNAILVDAVRGHLHDGIRAAAIRQRSKMTFQLEGTRSRVRRREDLLSDPVENRAEKTRTTTGRTENRKQDPGSRRLALGASDPAYRDAPRRVLVEGCTQLPESGTGVVDRIITNLGVLDVTHKGLHVAELAPGVTREEMVAKTAATIV